MKCDVIHQACLKNGFPAQFFWQVPVYAELAEQVDTGREREYNQSSDHLERDELSNYVQVDMVVESETGKVDQFWLITYIVNDGFLSKETCKMDYLLIH